MMKGFIAESLLLLKESGFEEASSTAAVIDREQIESFSPRWVTRYLVHPRGANVARITKTIKALESR
jgi:hypothetical protein